MDIPPSALRPEVLRALIEEFVTREGTDYGHEEHDLERKVAAVRRQLERGEAKISFDPESESVSILPATGT